MRGLGKRRSRRIAISQPATLTDFAGEPIAECQMCDVSEGGAGLRLDAKQAVPDQFELVLANRIRRSCKVVWRAKDRLGVVFAGKEMAPTMTSPEPAHEQEPQDAEPQAEAETRAEAEPVASE